MAPALLVAGAILAVVGVSMLAVPAGLIAAGSLLMAGAVGSAVVQEHAKKPPKT